MNILLYDLPEKEVAYIKANCNSNVENGEVVLYEWRDTGMNSVQEEKKLSDIVISGNPTILKQAVDAGITAIAYQNREAGVKKDDVQIEESGAYVIEKETLPQVDIIVEGFEEVDFDFLERIWQRHHHIPWTIFETERLLVRELTLDDMDGLFELYSYEGMTDYMEGLYPYEEEYAYQKAYIESMYGFFGYGMWLVFEKESGKLIGRAGVEHREALDGELELGYAIGTPWQGRGFATEVCQGILKYVQEELYFDEIVSLVEPANKASVHLLEKLGFYLEMELDLDNIHYKKYKKCFKPL